MGFSMQEYWSGLPFPSPGDLPNTKIKPASPALQADSLPLSNQGSPPMHIRDDQILGAGYCPGQATHQSLKHTTKIQWLIRIYSIKVCLSCTVEVETVFLPSLPSPCVC